MVREAVRELISEIEATVEGVGTVKLMEVCGTHTTSLFRSGIRAILPHSVELVSGPGCPVCVTSQGYIDAACLIAAMPGVIICTYGDMVRVPGRRGSLETQRAAGARVQVVYSARDAVQIAGGNPGEKVVFLAVGFETTAPATAAAVIEAERLGLDNFFVLAAHKLVVPAMAFLLKGGEVPIEGFLCPGHVSVIIGSEAYRPIVDRYGKGCVVAGFEPAQMLKGILSLLRQVREGEPRLENVYTAAVNEQGNEAAKRLLDEVFVVAPAVWRAMGELPDSGLELTPRLHRFDALRHFNVATGPDCDPPGCRCGEVIQGKVSPTECPLFDRDCTPVRPVGPCMVSSEGTCAAWYKYNRPAAAQTD